MKITPATDETVTLNKSEQDTKSMFDFYRTIGKMTVADAAKEALAQHKGGKPSKEFVEWLSDGSLTKADGEVTPAA